MNNDELRQICEEWLCVEHPIIMLKGQPIASDVESLMRLCRSQQAVGVRSELKQWKSLELYFGSMAEGQNEPEFQIYLKIEAMMRREYNHCEAKAKELEQP